MPAIRSETYGTGNQKWLGSTHGIYNCRTSSLDISAFTAAHPDGYIPAGTPVDAGDESAVVPATADTTALGFIYTDTRVVGDDDTVNVPVLRHGIINVDFLPVDFTVPTAGAAAFTFVGSEA